MCNPDSASNYLFYDSSRCLEIFSKITQPPLSERHIFREMAGLHVRLYTMEFTQPLIIFFVVEFDQIIGDRTMKFYLSGHAIFVSLPLTHTGRFDGANAVQSLFRFFEMVPD